TPPPFRDVWGACGASLRVWRPRGAIAGRRTHTLGRSPCFRPPSSSRPASGSSALPPVLALEARGRDQLLRLGSATVYEAAGAEGAVDPAIAPIWAGAQVCGPALPVQCSPGDNLAVHLALEAAEPGVVLVVDAHAHLAGYCGEVLGVAAQ